MVTDGAQESRVLLIGHRFSPFGCRSGSAPAGAALAAGLRSEEVSDPAFRQNVSEAARTIGETARVANECLMPGWCDHHDRPAVDGADEGKRAIVGVGRETDLSSGAVLFANAHVLPLSTAGLPIGVCAGRPPRAGPPRPWQRRAGLSLRR